MTMHLLHSPQTNDHSPIADPTNHYIRRVKIACDDLHDDPYDPAARAALRNLLEECVPPPPPVPRHNQR